MLFLVWYYSARVKFYQGIKFGPHTLKQEQIQLETLTHLRAFQHPLTHKHTQLYFQFSCSLDVFPCLISSQVLA